MAPRELFPAILALVFFAAASAVLCREEASHATATLDVAAALSSAAAAVSLDFRSKQSLLQQEQAKDGSRGFSVRLHPRESLRSPSHSDYRALTLSRLSRDESRVKSLNSRLQLAIYGVKRSDLKPLVQEVLLPSAAGFSGQIISGTSQGSGEYFSRIEIGTPPKSQYMVLDTGSDVTWTQCAPCADCYQQADPIFDPSLSSTFSRLSCQSSQCRQLEVSACRNDSCFYQVSYGDGSYTVGEFSTETVTLGAKSVPRVALGCGHDNEGLFVGAAGLLGLGGGALSFPKQVSAASFSYCLVDRDSTASSTLEFDSPASSAVSAPLLRNRKESTFYYLGLTGISVGGRMLSIPPSAFAMDEESGQGGVILDSGTSVSRLHADAYASLRDAFRRGTASLPPALAVALFDTCYDLAGRDSVVVPSVSLHFPGGKSLRLPAKNYLIPVDSIGTFCLAFAPTNSGVSIIGNVQQQGTRVSFDLANSLVSFSPNQC